jgi:predicted amidohydrolase YtcJ
MSFRFFTLVPALVFAGFNLTLAAAAPDTLYLNGTVITMTARDATAEAVAVKDGRILAVGPNNKIKALAGPSTKSIDLAGKTLLPGFYAAHDHFPGAGRVALFSTDLNSPPIGPMESIEDIVAALRAKAEKTPPGKWIVGRGYDDTLVKEHRHPTRHDLDRASTNHPIHIVHTSGHLSSANSLALKLAGVTKDTPQPAGGVIRKDPVTGEPDGIIEERTQMVGRLVPGYTQAQHLEAIRWCDTEYLSKGVTTTVITGGGGGVADELLEARGKGWLHLRVHAYVSSVTGAPQTLDNLAKLSPVPDQIRVSGVKMLQDGSLQGFTGYLTAPYYTQPQGTNGYAGYASRSREALTQSVLKYHRVGYQIAIHANGDAAIDDVLHAFRAAQKAFPRPDARHRIEHCQTPREDQLDAMKELGITPSFFVGHVYYWGDRHRDLFLGPERAGRISPLASALKRDIRFTIHNDTPVTPVNPLLLVWCSVNRLTRDGKVLGPEQRIGIFEALRTVTSDAAWQNFEEKTKGTIEPGKFADFVVLAENPLTIDPVKLKDIAITETIVGGKTVFKK